ncbi:uncharacterized protein LOC132039142 [Lycium ferocissimum]|uniref:uncharacterized protein LOC132039142 n=1 Tax=Lycium ferocissimum TaxID=112874 RepID=UPI0028166CC8|nr:uncharacterized protein LOC132039142 [Lycium ferocissimum]
MVRKIIEARQEIPQRQLVMQNSKSMIRQIYLQLLGQQERISWKSLMFNNEASAKARFTMWLHFHGRMLTSDRLAKWGLKVDPVCVLCQWHQESRNHLFVECVFIKAVWDRLLGLMKSKPYRATTWAQYF